MPGILKIHELAGPGLPSLSSKKLSDHFSSCEKVPGYMMGNTRFRNRSRKDGSAPWPGRPGWENRNHGHSSHEGMKCRCYLTLDFLYSYILLSLNCQNSHVLTWRVFISVFQLGHKLHLPRCGVCASYLGNQLSNNTLVIKVHIEIIHTRGDSGFWNCLSLTFTGCKRSLSGSPKLKTDAGGRRPRLFQWAQYLKHSNSN